jgi:hypothetical protein
MIVLLCAVTAAGTLLGCDVPPNGAGGEPGGEPEVAVQKSALTTPRVGSNYSDQCAQQGVPLPPDWGKPNVDGQNLDGMGSNPAGKWKYTGSFNDSYVSLPAAKIYYATSTSPPGVCVINAHMGGGGGTVGEFDLICQGTNGNACFWFNTLDQSAPSSNTPLLSLVTTTGTSQTTGSECTMCHAGENAFIGHPKNKHPLNLKTALSQWMPSNWYQPIVPPRSQQNPGPLNPEGYPTSTTGCTGCHVQGQAGRLPDVTSPLFYGEYCKIMDNITNLPGSQGGMPYNPNDNCTPGGSESNPGTCARWNDPFVKAIMKACALGTATSKAISPVAFEAYSSTSPYKGSWDHALVGKADDTSSGMHLFNNFLSSSGSFDGWADNPYTSSMSTPWRPTMWLKDGSGSKVAVASTDASGWIRESQGGLRYVNANQAAGSPFGYVRHDGYNTIVYRGLDNYIYESYWDGSSTWYTNILPGQTVRALGDPRALNRGGSSSVIYKCGAQTICEERLVSGSWYFRQLSTSVPFVGETMPVPFKKDYAEERMIFYAGTDGLHMIIDNGDPAFDINYGDVRLNPDKIVSTPAPYNPQDGGIRVAYITDPGPTSPTTVTEAIRPGGSQTWSKQMVVNPPRNLETLTGDPATYVATGPWRNTIIYRNTANTIYELQTINANSGTVPYAKTVVTNGYNLRASGTLLQTEEMRWSIDLPAGKYRWELTPSSGDADLYIKQNASVSKSQYDCLSVQGGTATDACNITISDLGGGTINVLALGYASSSGYSIVGYQTP